MTTSVEIPGGYAILRDQDELRGRDRNLIKAAAMAAQGAIAKMPDDIQSGKKDDETDEQFRLRTEKAMDNLGLTLVEAGALLQLREATIIAVLKEWTINLPLPTMETLGDLPADLYDALDAAIGGVTAAVAQPVDFDPQPGQENPTGGSTSSDMPSAETAEPASIPSLPSDGESTTTDGSIPV